MRGELSQKLAFVLHDACQLRFARVILMSFYSPRKKIYYIFTDKYCFFIYLLCKVQFHCLVIDRFRSHFERLAGTGTA